MPVFHNFKDMQTETNPCYIKLRMKNFNFRKPITYNKLKQEPGVSKGMVLVLSTKDQPLENQLLVDQL